MVTIPVRLDCVRGPVGGIGGHHGVVGDRVAGRALLRRRLAARAGRGHEIAGGSREGLVDGMAGGVARGGDPGQSRGSEQEDGGDFSHGSHLETAEP